MEKKKLKKPIGEEQCFDAETYMPNPTTIDEVVKWLLESKENGATHIQWFARTMEGDSWEVEAQAYLEYEETDEEAIDRINKEFQERKETLRRQMNFYKKELNKLESNDTPSH